MTKFTEGPWVVDDAQHIIFAKIGGWICDIFHTRAPDAHLIAAAPRLYAATEKLTEALEALVGDCPEVEYGRLALAEAKIMC